MNPLPNFNLVSSTSWPDYSMLSRSVFLGKVDFPQIFLPVGVQNMDSLDELFLLPCSAFSFLSDPFNLDKKEIGSKSYNTNF